MADLLDIAPSVAVESVHVSDGRHLIVRGLRANAVASLIARFPKLTAILDGNVSQFGPELIMQFGEAIGPIIAAGCDHLGDKTSEQYAAELEFEDQVLLLTTIIRLTFPKGLRSFVAMVNAINAMTASLIGTEEGAKPIRMRLKQSPSTSPLSSVEDSPSIM